MGVFESKIKEMSLSEAFGSFATGVSKDKALALWRKYDENGDGELDQEEAKHMVIDLAEHTVEWAKANIDTILAEALNGQQHAIEKMVAENRAHIQEAYKLIKDENVIKQIVRDFDTDGDGKISKEEFLARACEGYDIIHPPKRAKKTHPAECEQLQKFMKQMKSSVTVGDKVISVDKEIVGSSIYVHFDGFYLSVMSHTLASVTSQGLVAVAGQCGIIPGKGTYVPGGIGPETKQALENLKLVLEACGLTLDNLTKIEAYVRAPQLSSTTPDEGDFGGRIQVFDKAYRDFFGDQPFPPRTVVGSIMLVGGGNIEISATASIGIGNTCTVLKKAQSVSDITGDAFVEVEDPGV